MPAKPEPQPASTGVRPQARGAHRRRSPRRRAWPWLAEGALQVAQRMPDRPWPRFFPLAGDVLDSSKTAKELANAGPDGTCAINPVVVEIDLDPVNRRGSPKALGEVAPYLFNDYQRFIVNVGFACGAAKAFAEGVYTDPNSPWFNVFTGYYQIDVAKDLWERPFGYQRTGDDVFTVDPAELALLGQADWNFFSNYMYGVPLGTLTRLGAEEVTLVTGDPVQVANGRWWDCLAGSRIRVSSAYESAACDATRLRRTDRPLTELWRASFGQPYTAKGCDPQTSFFKTPISTEMLVSHDKVCRDRDLGADVYRTFVLGGVVNNWWADRDPANGDAHNKQFLDSQLDTLKTLASTTFTKQGFVEPGGGGAPGWQVPTSGTASRLPPFEIPGH